MSDPFHGPFPRAPLVGAGILLAATILTVAGVRLSGVGAVTTSAGTPQFERTLRFADRADGSVDVLDDRDGARVGVLPAGADGFVRATVRSLVRERKRRGLDDAEPFVLTVTTDNRLTLLDPATGRLIELEAFGPTNAAAFARLLPARG